MANEKKKILIVDDDKNYLWILQQSFAGAGFAVSTANDGVECLSAAKKVKPDVILLDILMPRMDGIEAARKLKEDGITSRIIFLTNLKDSEHINQAVEITKETDYIIKSDMSIDAVVSMVKTKLGMN